MAQISVRDAAGEKVDELDLDDRIFGVEVNVPLIHQAVLAIERANRMRTARTKTRSEIRCVKSKIYRQKGLGRARHGSRAANLFVGGQRAHGPKPVSRHHRLPKKMRRQAMFGALSAAWRDGDIIVVDKVELDRFSTRAVEDLLANLEADGEVLLVVPAPERNETGEEDAGQREALQRLLKSAANVAGLRVRLTGQLSVRDVVRADQVVFTRAALAILEEEWLS